MQWVEEVYYSVDTIKWREFHSAQRVEIEANFTTSLQSFNYSKILLKGTFNDYLHGFSKGLLLSKRRSLLKQWRSLQYKRVGPCSHLLC